jgi:hypothetical protein
MNEIIMKEYYDDMLNEIFGTIKICGYEYSASRALYRVDEIAYREGMNDYENILREAHEEDGSYADLFGDEEE